MAVAQTHRMVRWAASLPPLSSCGARYAIYVYTGGVPVDCWLLATCGACAAGRYLLSALPAMFVASCVSRWEGCYRHVSGSGRTDSLRRGSAWRRAP